MNCARGLDLVLLLVLGGSHAAWTQQPFVHGGDIAFTIRTDQKRYIIGEPIVVLYTVKNVSNAALFVPKSQWDMTCGDPPHLWARLEDSSGKHYEPGYGGSCLVSIPEKRMSVSEKMRQDATLLKPGQSLNGSFTFESGTFGGLRSGSYRLEADLYGWNSAFDSSEISELHRMGAPFLTGEEHAVTRLELHYVRAH